MCCAGATRLSCRNLEWYSCTALSDRSDLWTGNDPNSGSPPKDEMLESLMQSWFDVSPGQINAIRAARERAKLRPDESTTRRSLQAVIRRIWDKVRQIVIRSE